jgi:hypothetical protein
MVLDFYEEPLIPVLTNKLEQLQFQIWFFLNYKILVPLLVLVLKSDLVQGNLDENQQLHQ